MALTSRTERSGRYLRKTPWEGIFAGVVLLGIGAGFLLLSVVPNLWDAYRMQEWVHMLAKVEYLDVEWPSNQGYKVVARFGYDYQGQHYTGERVGIADGLADHIGDWQRDTMDKLQDKRQVGIWINLDNPSESVYDRELRWDLLGFRMIFVVVFGGLGAVLLWYLNRRAKLNTVPTGLPAWQTMGAWHDNNIRSNTWSQLGLTWGFVIAWNAISSSVLFGLSDLLAKGDTGFLIALIFPLAGLGLLVWAIRQTLAWRRFGTAVLHMDPFPGALGADVGGVLDLRLAFKPKHRFRVTLTCDSTTWTYGGDDKKSTQHDAIWQDEQLAQIEPATHGTRLRFLFRPPGDLPETSEGSDSWYEWNLQVTASFPGSNLDCSWEVPVFNNAGPQTAHPRIQPHPFDADSMERPDKVVRFRETGAGIEFYYPYLRRLNRVLVMIGAGGVFAGVAWLLYTEAGSNAPGPLVGLFAIMGILIFISGISLAASSLRITAGRHGLRVERRIFGLRSVHQIKPGEIITIKKSMDEKFRQGSRSCAYYKIKVHTRDGLRLTVGDNISDVILADGIIRRIHNALALPVWVSGAENSDGRLGAAPNALSAIEAVVGEGRLDRVSLLIKVAAGAMFFAGLVWIISRLL